MNTDLSLSRREEIAARLSSGQAVVAGTLAIEYGVSEDAIRRDLRALAAEGRCRRVYGGALPLSPASTPLAARIDEAQGGKLALARAAAKTVQPGELIFLDSGSTNLALVEALPDDTELTIVTNSPDIAAAALRRAELSVIVIGGMADPVVGGCVDATATQAIAQMRFDRAFIGACAVSPQGVFAFHHGDAHFKRAVIAQAAQVAVLAAHDKLEAQAPHHVAALDRLDLLIIEDKTMPEQHAALAAGGATHLLIAAALPIKMGR
ncbi:DeoR/GlpR family DNA-binding transcription regulator [Novosphingobium sp.]|uniref:DeoR/GlpR family DNA-binding transcription regulator n=1 Tax=Novosphingobium sp. TaxID=1874826 RepID=UPI0031CE030D